MIWHFAYIGKVITLVSLVTVSPSSYYSIIDHILYYIARALYLLIFFTNFAQLPAPPF